MSNHADLLIEIHTEELPPKALSRLGKAFLFEVEDRLHKAELSFSDTQFFATPRRLAILIKDLAAQQADATVERKGPALEAAFDKEGKPTPACAGFARSCGVAPEQLITIKNDAGAWVGYKQHVTGKHVKELLPLIVQQALAALPIPKRMRWGNNDVEFVRPAHSAILLYGNDVIDADILGCKTGRKTRGHRFHSQGWFDISSPADYAADLKKHYVLVDPEERKNKIRQDAKALHAQVHISDALLDEVTSLVEWPVAVLGQFDKEFLDVPQEALISAMQDHQRYFPIIDPEGNILPQFITISNIESKDSKQVIAGNERVLRARLSDAKFFFDKDKKTSLESRVKMLEHIIFHAKLGTVLEKAQRISRLAEFIAPKLQANASSAKQLGLLAKTDLTTELVGEFPELQGIAGYYYAYLVDGIAKEEAKALYEQYQPRFANDALPATALGKTLAIADRMDSLVGMFGINQLPTGDKDPYGLRRAAIGILRIIIDGKHDIDLKDIVQFAVTNYSATLENKNVAQDSLNFMLERLKAFYQEQNITPDVFAAVTALNITKPYDIHQRILAVQAFKQMPAAEALSVANKRVSNILAKYTETLQSTTINETLFEIDAERTLATKLKEQQQLTAELSQSAQYAEVLSKLAYLREPVDAFFDQVMVMSEDKALRENRLLMLKQLRELFLHVADIALLQ